MKRKKHKRIYYFLLLFVLGLGVGYSFLTTDLSIQGVSHMPKTTWDIHFANTNVTNGSVTPNSGPTIGSNDTSVSYNITLEEPGDFFEFTVDVVNDGTLDGMISSYVTTLNGSPLTTLPNYMEYRLTYVGGFEVMQNQLLRAGTQETIKVYMGYKKDIENGDLPSSNQSHSVQVQITYVQATNDALPVPRPTSFATDDWPTIISVVRYGDPSVYQLGDTKSVDLGDLGVHTLRIANKSTPAECSTAGFSQTACGFVLEFADIITTHRMNLYASGNSNLDGSAVNGTGNKGGWEYSDMRAYLNSTIYANENIDYSTTGIYSSLPEVLRNAIINTTVVSGHGSVDTTNYTTTDKLYLLSRREVWNYTGSYDAAQGQTRQLDYYVNLGVTESNCSGAIKQRNGSNFVWWLRSAYPTYKGTFDGVSSNDGGWLYSVASNIHGVSPAFRIG